MKTIKEKLLRDTTLLIGLGLILLSAGIFIFPDLFDNKGASEEANFGVFILNYLISIAYFIIFWIREIHKFSFSGFIRKIEYVFIHLILALISAYSLNRVMAVFEQSVPWFQVFIVLQVILILMLFIKGSFSVVVNLLFWVLMGVICSMFLYLSIFLIPLYPIGLAASPAFGISLHAYIPLAFVIAIFIYLFRKENRIRGNIVSFCLGIIVSISVVILFVYQWEYVNRIVSKSIDKSMYDEKDDMPEWVVIAQNLPKNAMTEKFLKTGLVYMMAPEGNHWEFFNFGNKSFDEVKKHDPLVMIATFFLGRPNLSEDQKVKILESMYDSRHKAQERLWAGDDLQTKHVLTHVRIYPNLHIGYTEKVVTVTNTQMQKRWGREQEAIYTFHLPEGAVVTSLSLWINGKEEKAVLTAKHKADSAYRTIVGRESRDPSLVRWQEGNTVSVRVFPCSPEEDRRFKIGFTAPLRKTGNKLVYENIWFDGPAPFNSDETIKVKLMDEVEGLDLPGDFEGELSNDWTYTGDYLADWNFKFNSLPVKPNVFNFDNVSYQISEYQKSYSAFTPSEIYLDINDSWSEEEFNRIRELAKGRPLYAFQNQRIQITDANADEVFRYLSRCHFSIFPLYEINEPSKALIISKGTSVSPNISDLGDSDFSSKLKKYLQAKGRIKFYNIGQDLSPYIKTLKELRTLDFDCGSIDELSKLIAENKFIANQENKETIVVESAGVKITQKEDSLSKSNAPDHLMRLFAYNSTMSLLATNYFDKNYYDSSLIDNAYKAYVVSPVTSLVVLETQANYKRFDIKDNGSSLKNASMKSSGAVPEPHEWLLILVIGGVALFLFFEKRKKIAASH